MTNRIALWLGVVIVALIALNFALGLEAHVFLARKFFGVLEWIAFWH